MAVWTYPVIAVVTLLFEIIPSANTAGEGVQNFATFLAGLDKETTGRTLTLKDVETLFLKEHKNDLASLGSCRDRLLNCNKAGFWAYQLTCQPLNQCGGKPQELFLYYIRVNCMGEFGLLRGQIEDLRLGQVKRNRTDDLVLIVNGATPQHKANVFTVFRRFFRPTRKTGPNLTADEETDKTIVELSSCNCSKCKKQCNKSCSQAYVTLCTKDYTCRPSVLQAFAKNCKKSCRYYFD